MIERFDPSTEPMTAISLLQPWASLWTWGAKVFETRSWYTPYKGPIAIHASKGTKDLDAFLLEIENRRINPNLSPLAGYGLAVLLQHFEQFAPYDNVRDLFPLGAVIGMGELVEVRRVETLWSKLSRAERAFGNYHAGRWAWQLRDARLFKEPIPARGELSLWKWDPHYVPAPRVSKPIKEAKPKPVKEPKPQPVMPEPTHQQLRLF
jgi:activating signal cointegrator 1